MEVYLFNINNTRGGICCCYEAKKKKEINKKKRSSERKKKGNKENRKKANPVEVSLLSLLAGRSLEGAKLHQTRTIQCKDGRNEPRGGGLLLWGGKRRFQWN